MSKTSSFIFNNEGEGREDKEKVIKITLYKDKKLEF